MTVGEFIEILDQLTARQLHYDLVEKLENGPYWDDYGTKKDNILRIVRWAKGKPDRIQLLTAQVDLLAKQSKQAKVAANSNFQTKTAWIKRYLPEADKVLASAGGYKPQKFMEALEIRICPSTFNPSAQGDFAYTKSFVWNGRTLGGGPGYSYDTMLTEHVNPYERTVDVPAGVRLWVTTYDGQWGGYWSRVLVFIHPNELPAPPCRLGTKS